MAFYYQGIFKPKNPKKYKGNVNKIIFRSGLEKRFMLFLDNCPLIKIWNSEEIVVPYTSVDGKRHRYFVDFYVKTEIGQEWMVELKPFKQTKPPKKNNKNYLTESITFVKNQLKWESATKYAVSKGMRFVVITDKEIKAEYSDKKLYENLKESLEF